MTKVAIDNSNILINKNIKLQDLDYLTISYSDYHKDNEVFLPKEQLDPIFLRNSLQKYESFHEGFKRTSFFLT